MYVINIYHIYYNIFYTNVTDNYVLLHSEKHNIYYMY